MTHEGNIIKRIWNGKNAHNSILEREIIDACETGNLEVIKQYITQNKKLYEVMRLKDCPAHNSSKMCHRPFILHAAMYHHANIVAYLLDKGCDPLAKDCCGQDIFTWYEKKFIYDRQPIPLFIMHGPALNS